MAQAYPQRQQGWDTTSHDYNLHISNIERMTSVLPDVPRYPILHRFFNNKPFNPPEQQQPKNKNKDSSKSKKKVQILDQKPTISEDRDSSEDSAVDAETDGFIKQKRRGFELCKWKTF